MTTSIAGTIAVVTNLTNTVTGVTGATTTDKASFGTSGINITNGSGANQLLYHFYFAEVLNGTRTFDLTALPGTTGTVTLAQVKIFLIYNLSTGSTATITVGNAGSNPWSAPWSGSTVTEVVNPSGIMAKISPLATPAWTVSGTAKNLLLTTSVATSYVIYLGGA